MICPDNIGLVSSLKFHEIYSPDKIFMHALSSGAEVCISFRCAAWHVEMCRRQFEAAAVPKGGVVLLFFPQSWIGIAYFLGAVAHGCTASFMPCPSPKQDPNKYWLAHRALIKRIQPSALVTDSRVASDMRNNGMIEDRLALLIAQPLDEIVPDGLPDMSRFGPEASTPVLQHSSGTTGLKKGVMLSNAAIMQQVEFYSKALEINESDIIVSWLPVYHDMGFVACFLTPLILGLTVVMLDPFHWVSRPRILLDAIARFKGSFCWLPNFAFDHLVRTCPMGSDAPRLDSVRAFVNCSEPCQAETFARFAAHFVEAGLRHDALRVCYAMAEATFAVTQTPVGESAHVLTVDGSFLYSDGLVAPVSDGAGDSALRLLSAGRPLIGVDLEVRDSEGKPLPPGKVGEIHLRSLSLFTGYYRMPVETAERLVDGWYATHDRGFMWDDELYVLGRVDDLIIVAGRNFHAVEVEAVVNEVRGVKPGRAVAFGVANALRGTADLVIVAERNEFSDAANGNLEIRRSIREAVFQTFNIYPAEVAVVTPGWLQKTTSGKIERRSNVERWVRERSDIQQGG